MKKHLTEQDFENLLAGLYSPDVEKHLQKCDRCRNTWEQVRVAHVLLQQAEWVTPPPQLVPNVLTALEEEEHARGWIRGGRRWPILLVLMTLGALFISGLWSLWLVYHHGLRLWTDIGWESITDEMYLVQVFGQIAQHVGRAFLSFLFTPWLVVGFGGAFLLLILAMAILWWAQRHVHRIPARSVLR